MVSDKLISLGMKQPVLSEIPRKSTARVLLLLIHPQRWWTGSFPPRSNRFSREIILHFRIMKRMIPDIPGIYAFRANRCSFEISFENQVGREDRLERVLGNRRIFTNCASSGEGDDDTFVTKFEDNLINVSH